ncbi:MAG: hypothetical protein N3E51_00695 [Candidatus Micrarchaeota archaeon]|nr:hypothetical protein [Candidatus Micrarchaeota archaeon]
MDFVTAVIATSCLALAALVYLMWRAATQEDWQGVSYQEKKRWRIEEERRKERSGQGA